MQTQAGTIVTHAGATPYGERLDVTTRAGTGGPVLFEEHVCTRDPVGRVTSREESWRDTPAGGLGTRLYVYTYDSAGRLRTYEERAGTCASPHSAERAGVRQHRSLLRRLQHVLVPAQLHAAPLRHGRGPRRRALIAAHT